jgi:hypothetical protein
VKKGLAIALMESGDLGPAQALLDELLAAYPADVDVMRARDRIGEIRASSRPK